MTCPVCTVDVTRDEPRIIGRYRGKSYAIYRCLSAYEIPTPYNVPVGPPSVRVGFRIDPRGEPERLRDSTSTPAAARKSPALLFARRKEHVQGVA
jgi:hypothetical protein